jgi:hypothetical protein
MPSYGNIPLAAGCPKQWDILLGGISFARFWPNLAKWPANGVIYAVVPVASPISHCGVTLGCAGSKTLCADLRFYLVLTDEPKIEAIDGRRLQDVRTFGKRTYVTVTNSQADSLQWSFGSSNGVAILICRRRRIAHAMTYRPNTLPRGYRASEPLGSLCCRPDLRPFLLLFRVPNF